MKVTIKFFLVIIIAASTIFADDGNMGNGGYTGDGNMGNGGITCTINCPAPTPEQQNTNETETPNASETGDDDSILTIIDDYLNELFG